MLETRIETQKQVSGLSRPAELAVQAGRFLVLLAFSLAIFVFGSNYYPLFVTNGSTVYAAGLSAVFLAAALLARRSRRFAGYWPILYAFFTAAVVNLVSAIFAGYFSEVRQALRIPAESNQALGIGKLYDTILVVLPILLLTGVSGANLGSLFLRRGNASYHWGLGVGALVLVDFFTSALIFFGMDYPIDRLGSAVGWGLVFAFSNSLLEELWIRGLFLKKLVPLTGATGAVLLTSTWFGALHLISVAYLPAIVIPVFVLNTFVMGLACSLLILKTESLWGAWLIHAAADLFLFIAVLAVR